MNTDLLGLSNESIEVGIILKIELEGHILGMRRLYYILERACAIASTK